MPSLFEDMGTQLSPLGEISLRGLTIPTLGYRHLYEVKFGNEYLMPSMFIKAEEAFSRLGLAAEEGGSLHVVVGGLDLVYTTVAALQDTRVEELLVLEALQTVIQWHQQEKVPLGKILNADSRNRWISSSFFDLEKSRNYRF